MTSKADTNNENSVVKMRKRKQVLPASHSPDAVESNVTSSVIKKKPRTQSAQDQSSVMPVYTDKESQITNPRESKKYAVTQNGKTTLDKSKISANDEDSKPHRKPSKRRSSSPTQSSSKLMRLSRPTASSEKHSSTSEVHKKVPTHLKPQRPLNAKKQTLHQSKDKCASKEEKQVSSSENRDSKSSKKPSARDVKVQDQQKVMSVGPAHSKTKDGESYKTQKKEKPLDLTDPMAMLMMMEGRSDEKADKSKSALSPGSKLSSPPSTSSSKPSAAVSLKTVSKKPKRRLEPETRLNTDDSGSEGMSDWEDVHEHPVAEKSQVPEKPVEITLDLPDILKHKKR
ncbi:hypothetical protein PoB_007579700 [Plakobranchus ocellatus]|uniref:Uncharacterized protein n=1 Tax=Plakobranchus ocellatus TaxID=259542 RepID=A0AAV4DY65_9GAST|nr:hypothetical protein PoB_007579700 [Plakobranchus ocellatus]